MDKMKIGDHAIIIGGGFHGLLASRVLADYFHKVTVIERDLISESTKFEPRVGALQVIPLL